MTTEQEAKEITIEVFSYLADHPEIEAKSDLPNRLFKKLAVSKYLCRLCDIYTDDDCKKCPLETKIGTCGYYCDFILAKTPEERTAAANKIVELVKAWEV